MPTLILAENTTGTIGPLAAGTDFKVIAGRFNFSTTGAINTTTNLGFPMMAQDDFFVGSGKTVYISTKYGCTVHYENIT